MVLDRNDRPEPRAVPTLPVGNKTRTAHLYYLPIIRKRHGVCSSRVHQLHEERDIDSVDVQYE